MSIYIGVTVFVAIFGGVYEIFSHHVFSAYMVFAWVWPCVFGIGMYLLLAVLPISKRPGSVFSSIYNFGVAMFTTRYIYIGVINIYGTTHPGMVTVYTIIGHVFLLVGLISYIVIMILYRKQRSKSF